ncbi:hypothetical protein EDC39_103239 [Geothermobacter ehrlichii]|uniref:Uncharacterized protein n=1 Tax=Geothermobacter ehrlichii TaxID=213224 RepID=A0A5D3WMG2_9BACT|nr:hypothetical protein EDC39_103239 [Geothermobacter ehrlichii]
MSEFTSEECTDPAGHRLHICQLRKEGRDEEVAALMADPGHTCLNCNAVAKHAKNLCNPSPFSRA